VRLEEDAVGLRYSTASSSLAREFESSLKVSFICCFSRYSLALLRLVSALSKAASEAVLEREIAVSFIAARRTSVCAMYVCNLWIFRLAAMLLRAFTNLSIRALASARLTEAASKRF